VLPVTPSDNFRTAKIDKKSINQTSLRSFFK